MQTIKVFKKSITYFLLVLSFFFPQNIFSADSDSDDFDAGEMILHHIYDAHEWHVLDWPTKEMIIDTLKNDTTFKKIHVTIPLPIILWDGGLQIFMSSKFKHGKSVAESGGKYYRLYHGKIYHTNQNGEIKYTDGSYKLLDGKTYHIDENGQEVMLGAPKSGVEISNTKPLDFSITKNVFSLFFSVILLMLIFTTISKKYRKNKHQTPKGMQSFLEPIIIFVRDEIAKSAIGEKHYNKYLPFLLTVFFFIFLNNLLGLVPFFPGGANLTGNIAVPMVLAALVFIITTLSGTKYYWKHIFAMPGVPKPVLLILTPIEILGALLKPLVLMIRLFANITAGHIIILSFFSMIFIFGEMHPAAGYGVSLFSGLFVLFMMTLELLVAFLQAYVFTLLAAMYFGSALEEH